MKLAIFLPILFTLYVTLAFAQSEPQRYDYNLSGKVFSERSQPMPKTTVCFVPAERPVNGRIPCSKTDDSGNFDFIVKAVPDKYKVCASTSDSIFVFVGDKKTRVTCTETMLFGSQNESRKVLLKFNVKAR